MSYRNGAFPHILAGVSVILNDSISDITKGGYFNGRLMQTFFFFQKLKKQKGDGWTSVTALTVLEQKGPFAVGRMMHNFIL